MVRFVLIAPGLTDYDQQQRLQGVLNVPLNDSGREETQRVARELQDLGIEALYCCPCEAATQTAAILAEALGLKPKIVEMLQNLNLGLWQGLVRDDIKRKHPRVWRQWQDQPESVCPPEGETVGDAQKRVQTALAKLLKKHKRGTIALVVPEPLGCLVRAQLGQGLLAQLWRSPAEHGQWQIVDVSALSPTPA